MPKMKINFKRIATRTGGAAAGGIGAEMLSESIMSKMNPKVAAGLQIVGGAVLSEISPKNEFLQSVGMGVTAVGAVKGYKELKGGAASGVDGIGEDEFDETDTDLGKIDDPIGATQDPISGADDDDVDVE